MVRARTPTTALWLLVGVDFLARLSYGLARTPVLPLYAAFLGAGPEMIGLVGAAATLTGIAVKLPAGALSDSVGRRPMLIAGLLVFASGPFLILLARSAWALAGVRLYHGLATAVYGPVAMAAVASLAGPRRGEFLSWLSNTKILGKLLGAFLGGLILSLGALHGFGAGDLLSLDGLKALTAMRTPGPVDPVAVDFRRAYLACAGLGTLALLLGGCVLRNVGDAARDAARTWSEIWATFKAGVREVARDTRVLLASGCEGIQNLTVGILEHFLPVYAVFVAAHTPLEACLLYASQGITTLLARPVFGRWSDRHGRRGVIILGMILCAAPFAAIPWATGFGSLLALCLLFGLGEALVTSSSAALVTDLCRERSFGAAMGVFGTIKDAGHALGPILGGVLLAVLAAARPAGSHPALAPSAVPYRITFAIVGAVLVVYTVFFVFATRNALRSGRGAARR